MRPSREAAEEAVRTIIQYMGDDPDRPGLTDTPRRVIDAWVNEWARGYHAPLPTLTTFREGMDYNEMVLVRSIAVQSTCEHHLAPFFGTCDIGYISGPNGILGLSKFARIVDHFARRLQVQERLTVQIADAINEHVSPNCAVIMRCQHTCMSSRGICQQGNETTTSVLRGSLQTPAARAEFLSLTQRA